MQDILQSLSSISSLCITIFYQSNNGVIMNYHPGFAVIVCSLCRVNVILVKKYFLVFRCLLQSLQVQDLIMVDVTFLSR